MRMTQGAVDYRSTIDEKAGLQQPLPPGMQPPMPVPGQGQPGWYAPPSPQQGGQPFAMPQAAAAAGAGPRGPVRRPYGAGRARRQAPGGPTRTPARAPGPGPARPGARAAAAPRPAVPPRPLGPRAAERRTRTARRGPAAPSAASDLTKRDSEDDR